MTRRVWMVALSMILLVSLSGLVVRAQTSTPAPNETVYTVQPGDTLFRIAVRNRTTVTALAQLNGIVNPALIYTGQRLRIPGTTTTTPTPTPVTPSTVTPQPSTTSNYTVVRGDTLFRIAIRNRTTVSQLVTLNNLGNANLIYVGQVLKVPTGGQTVAAQPTSVSGEQGGGAASGYGFAYGVQVFTSGQATTVSDLGLQWVKVPVLWRDVEPVQGQLDFSALDTIVEELRAQNVRVLFTVSSAPTWARVSTDEAGPPDDFATFGTFMSALATHYAGQVEAYEIWNEPNLRREWNSTVHAIDAANYAGLLEVGYDAVKAADSAALVVSAGLAPTGFNDGVNALNDRLFLSNLYANGLREISDAVGAHPNGWANPPDALCCNPSAGVETHYQDPSFYFLSTLNDYRQIMVNNNDGSTAIWVTKFGWGTSEDTEAPSENNIFVSYTSLEEQATYNARGFTLGSELGFVGPMFLYNLNGCQVQMDGVSTCYYSLIDANGVPRPAFASLQALTTEETVIETPAPETLPTETPMPTLTPTAEVLAPEMTEEALPLAPLETATPDELMPLMPEVTEEAASG